MIAIIHGILVIRADFPILADMIEKLVEADGKQIDHE
jgi:hypothetical protein